MDGKALRRAVREALLESDISTFMDDRTTYDYAWEGASEYAAETCGVWGTQSITTVADQAAYDLEPDFLQPLLHQEGDYFLKFNDGTSNHFIYGGANYADIVLADRSSNSAAVPDRWTVMPKTTLPTQLSSSATSTAAAAGGKCTLTDSGADFSDVAPGDVVHNTTDGSDGLVVTYTSSTSVDTALFGGTANDWTSGDSYVIQPQARHQVIFDPPPSASGDTVTLSYVKRPAPVYHDYGVYNLPVQDIRQALTAYVVMKYKYRDQRPQESDHAYQIWQRALREGKRGLGRMASKSRAVTVKFKA